MPKNRFVDGEKTVRISSGSHVQVYTNWTESITSKVDYCNVIKHPFSFSGMPINLRGRVSVNHPIVL